MDMIKPVFTRHSKIEQMHLKFAIYHDSSWEINVASQQNMITDSRV
jgi:hypothetical protein